MPDLQTSMSNNPPGGVAVATGWPDDDFIQELGERIASLTLVEAVQLGKYLKAQLEGQDV